MKRTFTDEERNCVFDLWKQGAGFSDIGRVIDAKRVLLMMGERRETSWARFARSRPSV